MVLSDFLQRLEGVKGRNGNYMARCPCHDDSTQSLSVSVGEESKILLKCFAGCSVEGIVGAMGLSITDLFADDIRHNAYPTYKAPSNDQKPTKEAEYIYAGGQLKKVKYRRSDGSKFCSWLHKERDRWEKGRKDIAPGLYQSHVDLPDIFFLVEGEKDVDNLKKADMVAVSLPDGSQSKWEAVYNEVFRGKQIIILPDNDDPGAKYARMCAENIYAVAVGVKVLDLAKAWPEMPPKADVSDMIQHFGQDEAMNMVIKLANEAASWEPPVAEADPFLSLFKPLTDFKEEEATWLIPGWIPEAQITLIAADGGVGKTTLWCNIIAALSSGKLCVLDSEGQKRKPMKVAFCTTEDSVSKKLVKKLREAGANMRNVITMDVSADRDGALRNFKFGTTEMERFVRYFKPDVCVFDPVQGFIPPKVNMGSRNEMRDCMAPLIALGEETGTTFLVICHTNKRKGAYGRDRIADSADLWDISRSVIMAGYTENQGVRYLSNEKNNYEQLQETMLFSINGAGQIVREGTSWKRDKEYMLDAAMARTTPKREDCRDFIIRTLEAAEEYTLKSDLLQREAELHGHAHSTFRRARDDLKREGKVEIFATGNARGGTRTWFTKLRRETTDFEELPYDEPVPFDVPSA